MDCVDSSVYVNYRLRFGLVTGYNNAPDSSNLAVQLEMYFPPQNSDKLVINTVQNGQPTLIYEEDSAANYYEGVYLLYFLLEKTVFLGMDFLGYLLKHF